MLPTQIIKRIMLCQTLKMPVIHKTTWQRQQKSTKINDKNSTSNFKSAYYGDKTPSDKA